MSIRINPIDINQLLDEIQDTARGILGRDLTTYAGFSREGLRRIAADTASLSRDIASGAVTPFNRQFFMDDLRNRTRNLLHALQGLLTVTVEKLVNAVLSVLNRAISSAVSIGA